MFLSRARRAAPAICFSIGLALAAAPAAAQPAPAPPPAADPDRSVVSTVPVAVNRMAVDVRIGGKGPFRFLVDTGAQNSVIGRVLAERLALPAGQNAVVSGLAGILPVSTVHVEEISLGGRSFYSLLSPVLNERDMNADGIVGVDTLQGQRVLIDFRKQLLVIEESRRQGDAGYDIVVTARRRSGQLVMTDARVDGVPVNVVIDTGAESSVGNLALLAAMGRRGAKLEETELTSVTGQTTKVSLARVRQLKIHGMTILNATMAFVDAPPFRTLGLADKPAMLIGMRELRAFSRIAIDFRDRKVMFDVPDSPDLMPTVF